ECKVCFVFIMLFFKELLRIFHSISRFCYQTQSFTLPTSPFALKCIFSHSTILRCSALLRCCALWFLALYIEIMIFFLFKGVRSPVHHLSVASWSERSLQED